jgi:hypothetical protein
MSYEINKTSGTKLDDLGDNELLVIGDNTNGITLFGKNTANYGEQLNENFLRLLENFAKATEPTTPAGQSPIVGQLWWDTVNGVLKVRADSSTWKAVGTPLVSVNQPINAKNGELWYDDSAGSKQLKIYSGGSWQVVGPQSLSDKGASGLSVEEIDNNPIVKITVGSDDVAIFTNTTIDLTGTPGVLPEFPRTLHPGINLRSNTENGGLNLGLMRISSSGIVPVNDAVQNIGASNFRFNNVYASTLYGNGANVTNVAASTAGSATNATNAANIAVVQTGNTDVNTKYPVYVGSTAPSNQAVQIDPEFSYTPNSGGNGNPGLLKAPKMEATVFESKALTGGTASPTPPFVVASTDVVANLHAATADKWHTERTLTFTGAITSTATLDGSGNVSISTTVGSISIGATSITGTWVSNVANGTGVSISGTAGSGWTPTISIGQAVATNSNVQFNSLGVGTAAAGTTGEIRATGDIIGFYTSDATLKENIFPIEDPLKKLSEITGVTFDWTDEYIDSRGGEDGFFIRKKDVGVIAQEIEKVFPELVAKRENGKLAVKYDRLVSLLIEAVKELNNKVKDLEKKVR